MTKQLTLTGFVLQESSQFRPGYFIYNDPSNDYEHFIERFYRRNRQSGKQKQAVLKEAQVEWKNLELQSGEHPITRLQAPQPPKQVRDFGFHTVCNPSETVRDDECVLLDEATSSSVAPSMGECSATFPSAVVAVIDRDKYLSLTASTGSTHASASLVIEQVHETKDGVTTDSSMEDSCRSQSSPSHSDSSMEDSCGFWSSPSHSDSSVEDSCSSQSPHSHSAPTQEKMVKDKLGRHHYLTPHSGPALVSLRASRFHSSNLQAHIDDLQPIVEAGVKKGKTVVILTVDGGPDWSTNSLVNALFYMRFWRDNNLDVLVATSFAARFSAFNPIEHLWSPLSKKLNGVTFM